jgi:hypothetical protein
LTGALVTGGLTKGLPPAIACGLIVVTEGGVTGAVAAGVAVDGEVEVEVEVDVDAELPGNAPAESGPAENAANNPLTAVKSFSSSPPTD